MLNIVEITTSCGLIITIDYEDIEIVSKHTWHIRRAKNTNYARTNIRISVGKQKGIHLHRLITNCPKNMMVDHINGDGLDNRRCNLRIVTRSQNLMNSKKPKGNHTSQYKGVSLRKHGKLTKKGIQNYRWSAEIRKDRKAYWLGLFKTENEAALAYNKKAKELFGDFAKLNEIKL